MKKKHHRLKETSADKKKPQLRSHRTITDQKEPTQNTQKHHIQKEPAHIKKNCHRLQGTSANQKELAQIIHNHHRS